MKLIAVAAMAVVLVGQGALGTWQGASGKSEGSKQDSVRIAKVKVTTGGDIILDKKKVTFTELSKEFARVQAEKGVVWYYREKPDAEPTAEADRTAKAIIGKVVELKLPVRLSHED